MCGSPIDKQAGDAGNAMSVNLMINYKVQGNPINSAGVVNLFLASLKAAMIKISRTIKGRC